MSRRRLGSGSALAAVAALACVSVAPVGGQTRGPAPAATAPKASKWTPPRTPWGDPDISGTFTNKDEQGVPMERAVEFAGRQLVTEEEFAARAARTQKQIETDNADFDVETADTRNAGAVGSATSPPPHWLDRGRPSRRTSRIVDPADGRIPTQTPEGQKRIADRAAARALARSGRGPSDSYIDRSLYDRCISRGLPGSMMPAIYGDSYQIVQGPGWVGIRYEMIHEIRVIPLDGRPHASSNIRTYMGDARGHWDGTTLVVETTNFKPETTPQNANPETLRLIERFTPVAPDKVEWSVTFNDPTTWTRPWTFEIDLTKDASQQVLEYACHEGNYAMTNILTGARADEKAGRRTAPDGGGER
jgi:hypothetical protein